MVLTISFLSLVSNKLLWKGFFYHIWSKIRKIKYKISVSKGISHVKISRQNGMTCHFITRGNVDRQINEICLAQAVANEIFFSHIRILKYSLYLIVKHMRIHALISNQSLYCTVHAVCIRDILMHLISWMLHFSALECMEIYHCFHIRLRSVIQEVKSTQQISYSRAFMNGISANDFGVYSSK